MPKGFNLNTSANLKREINIRSVLTFFNIAIENNKCLCPFHDDKKPSMLVNDESVHCFAGCGGFDIFSFVQRFCSLATFKESLDWIVENKSKFPVVKGSGSRSRNGYRGPVNLELIEYYHSCLKQEHRDVLYTKRLLSDETINTFKIGWRPDWNAFSIPFWSGVPSQSQVDILQFRMTDATPPTVMEYLSGSKFVGLSGHNKPYLINKHLLTERWGVMLIGTFDGLLAGQDGFPATSPNGASVFSQKRLAPELNSYIKGVDKFYVVFDKTESERAPVERMISNMECDVVRCEFPDGPWKDYGDYRLHKTPEDFMIEVLKWGLS